MNIKNFYVDKENFKKAENYKITRGEKLDKIIGGVITGIMITSLIATPAFMGINNNANDVNNNPTEIAQEIQEEKSAKIQINIENPEIIENESSITIIDSNDVIASYIDITKEGLTSENVRFLHPDLDYTVIVRYNGQEKVVKFHTNSDDDLFNLTIDYANGNVNVTQVEKPKSL